MQALPILAWIFTALLAVLLIVCVAAGRGAIPKNHFAGIRLPALMQSESAWRAGHRAGTLPAAIALVVALATSVIGISVPAVYWATIAAFVIGVVCVFIVATRAAASAA